MGNFEINLLHKGIFLWVIVLVIGETEQRVVMGIWPFSGR